MPSRKAPARSRYSSEISKVRIDIGPDDQLPTCLIDLLFANPNLNRDALAQPPAKRLKVDAGPDTLAVSVARGELKFMRPCRHEATKGMSRTIHDAGLHLDLALREGQLSIRDRSTTRSGSCAAFVSLRPQDLSGHAGRILEFRRFDPANVTSGCVGSVIEVKVKRGNGFIPVKLSLDLLWDQTLSPQMCPGSTIGRKVTRKAIEYFFPPPEVVQDDPAWSPMDFYEAAYVPPKNDPHAQEILVPNLRATLFPYQKRCLAWLLCREGLHWSHGELRPESVQEQSLSPLVNSFRVVYDTSGQELFLSDVLQIITRDVTLFRKADSAIRGGILAEEMGLGKTLEILALISVNPRPASSFPDPTDLEPIVSKATLIVAPESLRQQWMSEMARHTPAFHFMHYLGCKKTRSDDVDELVKLLAGHDVVITTYSVLSAELHFAMEPPQRARRYGRTYTRMKSPLVKISWWRLCLDEAQMIESGYSHAATVARAIPRIHTWGITGTPVKNDVRDLFGLLQLLRYEPFSHTPSIWQSLLRHHKKVFQQLFRSIALRHTKATVRDEIRLPTQNRYVISMPFNAVEEQHYQSMFRDMTQACRLDPQGAPLVNDWDPEDYEGVMRIWLNRLRQTALHPEVGAYNRRVLGSGKDRPMRTIEEVLNAMLEQNENAIRNDERAHLSSRLALGQLYENSPRVRESLAIWEEVRDEAEKLVAENRMKLAEMIRENADGKPVFLVAQSSQQKWLGRLF